MKNTFLIITTIVTSTISILAQDLSSHLQKGLAEEEINRDPKPAIEHYGTLLKEFDKNRQLAATALFRIAECHRKLGDKNAAIKRLQQLITLYPKQENIITLANQNLTILGGSIATTETNELEISNEEKEALIKYKTILHDRPDSIKKTKYLGEAIIANHVRTTQFLLEQGSDPNGKHSRTYANGKRGSLEYLIELATNEANLSIVKLLLSHGANVTPNALADCIAYRYSNIKPVLLAAIKSTGVDFDYFPALEVCISEKREEDFNRLIANGADPKVLNAEGENLLFTVQTENLELYERLIKVHNLNVNHRNKLGLSVLDYAVYKRSSEIVKILLSHGADPKAHAPQHWRDIHYRRFGIARASFNNEKYTASDLSVMMQLFQKNYQTNHAEIVNIINQLVIAGADVNHQDSAGNTVLHYAIEFARKYRPVDPNDPYSDQLTEEEWASVIITLLNAGVDKNLKNKEGFSPKDEARAKGKEFEALLK